MRPGHQSSSLHPHGRTLGKATDGRSTDCRTVSTGHSSHCQSPQSHFRVVIDIIGPLTRTKPVNHYFLTMIDHASRYQDAVPLRLTDSKMVTEALLAPFSRLGVPAEVLTDYGSNFLSSLMEYLHKSLGVRHIRTSPYHPQTNGAAKKLHGTLKDMIRKIGKDSKGGILYCHMYFCVQEVRQVLPFQDAHREAHQRATGCSEKPVGGRFSQPYDSSALGAQHAESTGRDGGRSKRVSGEGPTTNEG